MAKITEVKFILELNGVEARWLKGMVQNPLCYPDEEEEKDKEMRHIIWDALLDVKL